jgi:hypothetical protein
MAALTPVSHRELRQDFDGWDSRDRMEEENTRSWCVASFAW